MLEISEIMHQTEYHAGFKPMTDTKKLQRTKQPNKLIALFLRIMQGNVVSATYAATITSEGSLNKGL